MRRGTRLGKTANWVGPERCLQVRRRNVGTTRTAGAQASLRARTFLDSSRGLEHGKRVRTVPSSVVQRHHPRRPRQTAGCMNKCESRLNMEALVQGLLAVARAC